MPDMIFVSLPVKDLELSERFYAALGCQKNDAFSTSEAATMMWSETITLQLHTHDHFGNFVPKTIVDAKSACEVLIALSRETREDVDKTVETGAGAGGKPDVRAPLDMGFMYNRSLEDPDGHVLEFVWLDMAAAAGQPS